MLTPAVDAPFGAGGVAGGLDLGAGAGADAGAGAWEGDGAWATGGVWVGGVWVVTGSWEMPATAPQAAVTVTVVESELAWDSGNVRNVGLPKQVPPTAKYSAAGGDLTK